MVVHKNVLESIQNCVEMNGSGRILEQHTKKLQKTFLLSFGIFPEKYRKKMLLIETNVLIAVVIETTVHAISFKIEK